MYTIWWSQEGVFRDIVIADCATGKALRTRTKEERISDRLPFDRSQDVEALVEKELSAGPSLFSFDRLAAALKGTGRDTLVERMDIESCACAALYPDLLGTRARFSEALR